MTVTKSGEMGGIGNIRANVTLRTVRDYYEDGTLHQQWQQYGETSDNVYHEWTQFSYDALGRTVETREYGGGTVKDRKVTGMVYDVLGRVAQVTDPDRNVTKFEYDNYGRQTAELILLGGVWVARVQRYDAFGNLVQTVDRNKRAIQYTYDALGR